MTVANLKGIADQVVRRAQRQGYVVPREVREELTHAGAGVEIDVATFDSQSTSTVAQEGARGTATLGSSLASYSSATYPR